MARLLSAMLVGLLAVGLSAGCGDEGDDERPSKAERRQAAYEERRAAYVEEADARCRRLTSRIADELAPYERRLGDPPAARASRALVEFMAPRVEYEIRAIRILVLPNRDVEEVLAVLSAWVDDVQRAKRDPVAFVEAGQAFPEAERLARRFGFRDCAAPLPEAPPA
jgi:hypothetical protein